jgi:hypothetical protein
MHSSNIRLNTEVWGSSSVPQGKYRHNKSVKPRPLTFYPIPLTIQPTINSIDIESVRHVTSHVSLCYRYGAAQLSHQRIIGWSNDGTTYIDLYRRHTAICCSPPQVLLLGEFTTCPQLFRCVPSA